MEDIIKEKWAYRAENTGSVTIVPDGCRDIVIKQDYSGQLSTVVSPLAIGTYQVTVRKNTQMVGFRLTPGTTINELSLALIVQSTCFDNLQAGDYLETCCQLNTSVKESLDGLSSDLANINLIAKNLGVSMRTLQRHVKQQTGENPQFWRSLVRARRCARLLGQNTSLTESAFLTNYSDQAHMTREMQRWFSCTPLSLKKGWLQPELTLIGYD